MTFAIVEAVEANGQGVVMAVWRYAVHYQFIANNCAWV